jgi:DNA-binding transcriptional LysR family regulator
MEVAKTGSFSAAARNLGLTQPAVSFQIRSLEKEYGNTLIDRSTGHCHLTESGQTFAKYAAGILEKEEELRREMMEKRSEISGPLTISASNIPGEYIIPRVIARFRERYPLTYPQLFITDSGKVLKKVRAGEVDVGAVGYREDDQKLAYGVLCEDRLVFIAAPDSPLAKKRDIRPQDLQGEAFIWREEGSGTRSHMTSILSDLGLEGEIEGCMKLGSTMAVIQAVASGAGISLTSLWAADAFIRQGKIAAFGIKGRELKRDFYYVTLRRRPASPAASAFLDMLDELRPALDKNLMEVKERFSAH